MNIVPYLFMKRAALISQIGIVIFVIAGNPVRSFKMVGNITKEVFVFVHHTERNNIASQ